MDSTTAAALEGDDATAMIRAPAPGWTDGRRERVKSKEKGEEEEVVGNFGGGVGVGSGEMNEILLPFGNGTERNGQKAEASRFRVDSARSGEWEFRYTSPAS